MEEHKIDRVEEEKVDLFRLLQEFRKVFRRFFWFPFVLAVLCGVLSGLRLWRSYTPMYASSVTFAVQLTDSSLTDIAGTAGYYDKAAAEQLSRTFPHLLQSELMQNKLRAELGVSALNGSISAQAVENTNMFSLRVTSPDPQAAYDILCAVIRVYPEIADYVVGQTGMTLLTEPDVAAAPYNAFRPLRTVAKGAAAGFAAGLALLFLYGITRKTLRDPKDVRTMLNQKCIAALPRVSFKRREKGGHPAVTILNRQIPSSFQESIRSLRIRILREMEKEQYKVLMVTSTMPGEGKSTVAANLALSMSQNGAKVILVDLDLRKPSIRKILDIRSDSDGLPGLLGEEQENMLSSLTRVGDSSLYLLAGDTAAGDVYKALHSHRLYSLIRSLRNEADYIILDTPPSGILADSVSISRAADAAIYVLGADIVERAGALDGLQFLGNGGVHLLGCVLNGTKISRSGYGGKYGYGYGYGKYTSRSGKYTSDSEQ